MVHPYNGLFFSAKKKEPIKSQKTWRNLKCLLLSERIQFGKVTYGMIITDILEKAKL